MTASATGNEARILVVDDSRFDRDRACDALDGLGRVLACESAEAALETLRGEPVDVVVSDLTMPGLSGLDLLERARREHPGCDFVLLTGDASVESAIEALRKGAADYLLKPVPEEALRRSVETLLSRRRLLEENRNLRDSLRTVEACRALLPCLDANEIYPVALDLALSALDRKRALALFHRSGGAMSDGAAFRGFDEGSQVRLRRELVDEKPLDLAATRHIESSDHGPIHEALRRAGVEPGRLLLIPIQGQEVESGLLALLDEGRPFEDEEIERVGLVASHARASLRNAERYSQAQERAFVDDVTEAYNARYLLSTAEHELRRAERYGTPLSVLFLDLDRFKLVNDRHGHLVGSQTLRNLAQMLQQSVRQVDTLARYGGDEFTILLVDTPHPEALAIAERIRRQVADTPFEAGRGEPLRLTVSIGVGTYPHHGQARDTLLDASDKAMYLAKSRGRNRVCSADDLGEPASPASPGKGPSGEAGSN